MHFVTCPRCHRKLKEDYRENDIIQYSCPRCESTFTIIKQDENSADFNINHDVVFGDNCPICDKKLIWMNDFDNYDINDELDEEAPIISEFICPNHNCNLEFWITMKN